MLASSAPELACLAVFVGQIDLPGRAAGIVLAEKRKAMIRPERIAKITAPRARARPSSHPRTLAVSTMARTLMAGPE